MYRDTVDRPVGVQARTEAITTASLILSGWGSEDRLNMNELRDLILYRTLTRRAEHSSAAKNLVARIDLALDDVTRVLGETRRYFHHFTDHSVTHSLRIVRNIGQLLRTEQLAAPEPTHSITSVDIYLLIGAALVHDLGMVIAEGEINDLVATPAFAKLAE